MVDNKIETKWIEFLSELKSNKTSNALPFKNSVIQTEIGIMGWKSEKDSEEIQIVLNGFNLKEKIEHVDRYRNI